MTFKTLEKTLSVDIQFEENLFAGKVIFFASSVFILLLVLILCTSISHYIKQIDYLLVRKVFFTTLNIEYRI